MICTVVSVGQETGKNSARLEMISIFSNKLGFHLERSFFKHHAVVINTGFTLPENHREQEVFEIYPEYRFYYEKRGIAGWYVGPHLRYRQVSEQDYYKTQSYGFGVHFGYQFYIAGGIVINLFFGPEYALGNVESNFEFRENNGALIYSDTFYPYEINVPKYKGTFVNGGVALGINF